MVNRERLLQEDHIDQIDGPWRVLVICICLNMTTWKQVEPFLDWFFYKYPTCRCLIRINVTDAYELQERLRPLGMFMNRYARILVMSSQYDLSRARLLESYDKFNVERFSGCGQYAKDAWTLFVLKSKCDPSDKQLKRYAEKVGLLDGAC